MLDILRCFSYVQTLPYLKIWAWNLFYFTHISIHDFLDASMIYILNKHFCLLSIQNVLEHFLHCVSEWVKKNVHTKWKINKNVFFLCICGVVHDVLNARFISLLKCSTFQLELLFSLWGAANYSYLGRSGFYHSCHWTFLWSRFHTGLFPISNKLNSTF